MKNTLQLFGLLVLVIPTTALAYGASAGAILEFASLCLLIPLIGITYLFTGYLKRKAPILLHIALTVVGFLSIVGVFGMLWSFTTEVGYRPLVLAMHTLLVFFVFFAAKRIYEVISDS